MDSVHHIWCPLSSQEYQDLPDGAETTLTLGEAWSQYKHERGKGWTAAIHSANERYMEVLLTILGDDRDVATITKRDIKQVMEVVEGLPKRVIQPYRSMNIKQLIACDVPEEHLIGTEAIHKHLKIYKSLFIDWPPESPDNQYHLNK